MKQSSPALRSIAQSVLFSLLLLACMSIFIWIRYGSFQAAALVAKGETLFVLPRTVDVGAVRQGSQVEVDVYLHNESAEEISVLGVNSCCYASLIEEIPIKIGAREKRRIRIGAKVIGKPGEEFRSKAPIISTHKTSQPTVELVGKIVGDR